MEIPVRGACQRNFISQITAATKLSSGCALHPPVFQHRRSTRKLTPRASAPSLSELSRLHAEGVQIVHRDKRLEEKLGSNNPCPCGSGQRFKKCCLRSGRF
ncbi:MAG: SEC-C domain-containing protein [Pirellulaceae bacterium]|nr:SEC-C domain-containing protein [Pirellulaceae bacterium]